MPDIPLSATSTEIGDDAIRDALFALLDRRAADATVCPSEVARALAPGADAWRALMPRVREVAGRLAAQGRLTVTRRGIDVEATRPGGPIRLGRPPATGHRRPRSAAGSARDMIRIGLIADTHGLLRPEALAFLRGSDAIVHAGDIGNTAILDALGGIAPLTVVRGNNDTGDWARAIPETAQWPAGGDGAVLFAIHDVKQLDAARLPPGVRAVVAGHSHKPSIEQRGRVLFVNPGSAGPRRFKLPVSVGELVVDGDAWRARTVLLDV